MNQQIISFSELYKQATLNPSLNINSDETQQLYKIGLQLIRQSNNATLCEQILIKLITIFPEKAKLYYLMGDLFTKISPEKAIMWHKICYSKKPHHMANIVALANLLHENGMIRSFINLDQNNLFDRLINKSTNNAGFLKIK